MQIDWEKELEGIDMPEEEKEVLADQINLWGTLIDKAAEKLKQVEQDKIKQNVGAMISASSRLMPRFEDLAAAMMLSSSVIHAVESVEESDGLTTSENHGRKLQIVIEALAGTYAAGYMLAVIEAKAGKEQCFVQETIAEGFHMAFNGKGIRAALGNKIWEDLTAETEEQGLDG